MIGLVVISHSSRIAEGIAEMAAEMVGDDLSIFTAGGGPDGCIGTSPGRIATTLRQADDRVEEILVIADLGSALINIRIAKEQEDIDARIVDCPIVEGTLSAAIETMKPDATADTVSNAAKEAWNIDKGIDR